MKVFLNSSNAELQTILNEVSYVLGMEYNEKGLCIDVKPCNEGLTVRCTQGRAELTFHKRSQFVRALGLLAEQYRLSSEFSVSETPAYEDLSFMIDNSRNAVLNVPTVKKLIRHLALMGYTTFMLYTEDTYEIKDYPHFGYMRGRFTAQQIKECDAYAQLFGIELVPCVQTLAHLNAALRWPEFQGMIDFGDILLVGEEKTYRFLDSMLASVSGMFTSRRIHIGMDEAGMLGLGSYLNLHGYQNRSKTMLAHLQKVTELCKKYQLQPMMWSDMFFNLAGGEYHSGNWSIPDEVINAVPPEVTLVYWDYYRTEQSEYDKRIKGHFKFKNQIMFAGGAWKWVGIAPMNEFGLAAGKLALKSCKENGMKQVLLTAWGDNGGECSVFAALPIMQLYAENCYQKEVSDALLARRFATCTGASFASFMLLDQVNRLPNSSSAFGFTSKAFLFQDLLCGLFDRHILSGSFNRYYQKTADTLKEAMQRTGQWRYLFETHYHLCRVLKLKCDLGIRLKEAYDQKDRAALETIETTELPELLRRVRKLHSVFRAQWMKENNPFGFDVQDFRFGGLLMRIQAAITALKEYRTGSISSIEELEQARLPFDRAEDGQIHEIAGCNAWDKIVTANVI